MLSICVYCGSADELHPEYLQAARDLGASLAAAGIELIFGAGRTGLMGAVADSVLEAGGKVTGVIVDLFNTPQLCHQGLTRLEVVATLHKRKARMAELAEAFIALPGGFGTWEELFEILTWAQIGLHQKPIGVLNVRGYYDPLIEMTQRARREGFIYNEHRQLFQVKNSPADLLAALRNHRPPDGLERWLTREELGSVEISPPKGRE